LKHYFTFYFILIYMIFMYFLIFNTKNVAPIEFTNAVLTFEDTESDNLIFYYVFTSVCWTMDM